MPGETGLLPRFELDASAPSAQIAPGAPSARAQSAQSAPSAPSLTGPRHQLLSAWQHGGLLFRELECNAFRYSIDAKWANWTLDELIADCVPLEIDQWESRKLSAASLLSSSLAQVGGDIYSSEMWFRASTPEMMPFGNKSRARIGLVVDPASLSFPRGAAMAHDGWCEDECAEVRPHCELPEMAPEAYAATRVAYLDVPRETSVWNFTCWTTNWTLAIEQQRAFWGLFSRSPELHQRYVHPGTTYNQVSLRWRQEDVRAVFVVEDVPDVQAQSLSLARWVRKRLAEERRLNASGALDALDAGHAMELPLVVVSPSSFAITGKVGWPANIDVRAAPW